MSRPTCTDGEWAMVMQLYRLAFPERIFSDRWHGYQIKFKFGINAEKYAELLADQNGRCAICWRTPAEVGHKTINGRVKRLAVDHDKETGLIRGLLCSDCNQAIGLLRHCPDFLRSAITYLQKTTTTMNQRKL